jgi:hypothetical protein
LEKDAKRVGLESTGEQAIKDLTAAALEKEKKKK